MFNIDSCFNKKTNEPLNNISLGDDFDEFINNLDVKKTTKKINSWCYYLLKCKLQSVLEKDYENYILCYIENNDKSDYPNTLNTPKQQILDSALMFLKTKYKALRKYDNKFKKLNEIEEKYNMKGIDEFNIRVI